MKVHPFTIPKQPDDNIIVQVDKGSQFYNHLHQHEEIQLSYIISGKGRLVVGNNVTTYGPNDLIGIGANLPHIFQSAESNGESHMISLFFLKDCFGKDFFLTQEMNLLQSAFEELPLGIKLTSTDTMKKVFESLVKANKFEVFIALLQILRSISSKKRKVLSEEAFISNLSANQGKRLQDVMDYTLSNFNQHITLDKVAKKSHMGKNSFCRFFKQRTNKTFFQFLAEVRMHYACQLLIEKPDLSVSDIAIEAGYQSISNFNRQFKEILGVNPKTYRKTSLTKF